MKKMLVVFIIGLSLFLVGSFAKLIIINDSIRQIYSAQTVEQAKQVNCFGDKDCLSQKAITIKDLKQKEESRQEQAKNMKAMKELVNSLNQLEKERKLEPIIISE